MTDSQHRASAVGALAMADADLASDRIISEGAAVVLLTLALGHALLAIEERSGQLVDRLSRIEDQLGIVAEQLGGR